MKKFNSLFYLGLALLTMPVLIFIVVAFASSRPANIQTPKIHKIVIVDITPKEIIADTIKEIKPSKPVKKKKIEILDSIQTAIQKDTSIQKDTLH